MEEKLQKPYHYQILLIISLKEFIRLNPNMNMIIKNVKHVEVQYYKCYCYENVEDDIIVVI